MPRIVNQIMRPVLQRYSMSWLKEKDYRSKSEAYIKEHIKKVSGTGIGRKLGVTPNTPLRDIPLTHYNFYKPFFENPHRDDFIYPIHDYVRAITSGTMGKPKTYLLPKTGLWNSIQKTGMTFLFLCTHDGEKITYEVGDVVYHNMPGGQFISSFYYDIITNRRIGWVDQVPDPDMPFQEKVDYFLKHHREIDVAYMTVTTLIDQIYPQIGEPVKLKGFITQDRSAYALKDKIKEITGNYPKTIFGSTETMFVALPSIEYPGCFFFDWRVLYSEFIPEEHVVDTSEATTEPFEGILPLNEVEVGKVYQLVATPYGNDLIRYAMPDLLECISLEDRIIGSGLPVFRYYARCDNLIVLHNFTRINEDELIEVLNRTGAPYVDFVAVREAEFSRDYMKIYVEPQSTVDEDDLKAKINEQLLEYDKDWHDLTHMLGYLPLKLEILPKGSFHRYLQRRVGIPKITRINMTDDHLMLLLGKA
ncbi:MAG: GH3 auxin-responsive promoter family protein [Candidatus Bathyarchaeota archaeon]